MPPSISVGIQLSRNTLARNGNSLQEARRWKRRKITVVAAMLRSAGAMGTVELSSLTLSEVTELAAGKMDSDGLRILFAEYPLAAFDTSVNRGFAAQRLPHSAPRIFWHHDASSRPAGH